MVSVLLAQNWLTLAATLVMLALKAWMFVDAVSRRPELFVAADKLTKPAWLIILGLTVAAHMLLVNSPLGFLNLIGLVAAIVYLVDARPAMKELTGRR